MFSVVQNMALLDACFNTRRAEKSPFDTCLKSGPHFLRWSKECHAGCVLWVMPLLTHTKFIQVLTIPLL